jgi:hypothetical protein
VRATPTEIGRPSSARTRRQIVFTISAGGPFVSGHFKEYERLGNAAIEVVSNFTPRRADFD